MQNACTLNKLNLLRNTVTLLHAISLYAVVRLHITCFHFRQPLRNITQPPPPRSVKLFGESYRSLMLKRLWTPESTDQNVTALEIISVQLLSNEILFLVF